MSWALKVRKTGALFRLVSGKGHHESATNGSIINCYNAMTKDRRGDRGYDRTVQFVFDSKKHEIVDASPTRLVDQEKQRAKELMCLKHHPHKCDPVPYETKPVKTSKEYKPKDPAWLRKESLRVLEDCLKYHTLPGSFDQTKAAALKFDLIQITSMLRREDAKAGEGTAAVSGEV